jgi:hypothetical protein
MPGTDRIRAGSADLSRLSALLSLNPHLASFTDVAHRVETLTLLDRKRALSLGGRMLQNRTGRTNESARVAAAKTLVALAPDSAGTIRRLLDRQAGRGSYEAHFSLFCFLDEVHGLPRAAALAREVPSLIERYLKRAKVETAHAAWMAGDLLGDHWPVRDGLPILRKMATQARFAAGRSGAIHGLGRICARSKGRQRLGIERELAHLSRVDRSGTARAVAGLVSRRPVA